MSVSLSARAGSFESLNCRQRCGARPCTRQIVHTVEAATPVAFAIARTVQRVASCGSLQVRSTISAVFSGDTGGLPGGRVLSRRRPSTPSCMKHS